mgnify:CR=1 FL=1
MFLKKTILIALLLAALLLFAACTAPSGSPSETTAAPTDIPSETTASADNITDPPTASGTEAPSGETTAEDETTAEETTAEETTELVLTASPSLGSVEDIPGIGLQCGETIIAGKEHCFGGPVYCGKTENGSILWGISEEEAKERPIYAGKPFSEDTPILVLSLNDEIEIINHTGFPIIDISYDDYQTGKGYYKPGAPLMQNSVPTDPGIYILSITVKEPIPTEADPEPEIGTVFSEWGYYFLVVVEK